jgi:hypothetical protein
MTLDPEHHRAFLSCEENNLMTIFDLDRHEPIEYLAMADGPDVIKFDPGLGDLLRLLQWSHLCISPRRPAALGSLRISNYHMLYTALR